MVRHLCTDFDDTGQGISWAVWAAEAQEVLDEVLGEVAARHEQHERYGTLDIESMTSLFYECNSGGVDRTGGRDGNSA